MNMQTGSLWDSVVGVSDRIINNRHEQQIFMKAVEEMGELAVEVAIHRGESYKTPGPDGIVGEAIDVINCLLDLIHVHAPHMTEADVAAIARVKQLKWEKAIDKQNKGS